MLDEKTGTLVSYLEHPNGWVRDVAQQQLVQDGGKNAVDGLRSVARTRRVPLAL